MKATIRVFSALMLCALAPMVITGCNRAGDDTSSTGSGTGSTDSTAAVSELDLANKTVAALDHWMSVLGEPMSIKKDNNTINAKVQAAFLSIDDEAASEGDDFFFGSWEDFNVGGKTVNGNRVRLENSLAKTDAAFKDKTKFTVASVGSSSTQIYHVKADGALEYFGFYAGTTPSADRDALIKDMTDKIIAIGKPVVFINSIAFARPEDGATGDEWSTKLDDKAKFHVKKKDSEDDDTAGIVANMLVTNLKGFDKGAYLWKKTDKADKLINKWTMGMAKNDTLFKDDDIGFIVDFGGGGLSTKAVIKNNFDDTVSWSKEKPKDQKDKSEDYTQAPVVAEYKKGPDAAYVNDVLKGQREKIQNGLQRWADDVGNKDALDKLQKDFPVVIFQTGQLRELYFKSKAIIKAAEEAAAKKKEEEKKGDGSSESAFFFTPMKNELFANRNSSKLAA